MDDQERAECWAQLQERVADLIGPPGEPAPSNPRRHRRWEHAYTELLSWMPDLSSGGRHAWKHFENAHHERCAICFGADERLVRDHDHETGLIRGLLCYPCNKKTPSYAWRGPVPRGIDYPFLRYTQWPPAAEARHRERYSQGGGHAASPEVWDILWRVGADGLPERYPRPSWHQPGVKQSALFWLVDDPEVAFLQVS